MITSCMSNSSFLDTCENCDCPLDQYANVGSTISLQHDSMCVCLTQHPTQHDSMTGSKSKHKYTKCLHFTFNVVPYKSNQIRFYVICVKSN